MKPKASTVNELRPEYEFDYSKAEQGKYFHISGKRAQTLSYSSPISRRFSVIPRP